jgi:hypothetical protein
VTAGVGKGLHPLPGPADEGEARIQLRGDVGAELQGELADRPRCVAGEAEHGRGIGAAAPKPGGDRNPLADLDSLRSRTPAAAAQALQRPLSQVLALESLADDRIALSVADLDSIGQRERLEQGAELVQAVLAVWPQIEA